LEAEDRKRRPLVAVEQRVRRTERREPVDQDPDHAPPERRQRARPRRGQTEPAGTRAFPAVEPASEISAQCHGTSLGRVRSRADQHRATTCHIRGGFRNTLETRGIRSRNPRPLAWLAPGLRATPTKEQRMFKNAEEAIAFTQNE